MDFLSLVRAKKKGKKFIPIFIQKLRVRVIYECVLYSTKYGTLLKTGVPIKRHMAIYGCVKTNPFII